MLEGYNIICFAPGDWWGMNPSCTTHIMKRFSGRNKVLWINPVSSDILGSLGKKRKGLWVRIKRKLKSMAKYIRQPQENLYVFSPFFLPFQGVRGIDGLNNFLLQVQLKIVLGILGMKNPLLWVENIRWADTIDKLKHQCILYHVSDLFSKCGYTLKKEPLEKREQAVSKRADVVICVSKALYELKKKEHSNVHYLPHGVDYALFRQAAQDNPGLAELDKIPHPIAGYYGTLTAGNDIDLLEYCARSLPDISFVFVGQVTRGDYSTLFGLPNVYYLGKFPYEKIPPLCASFDVCLLPWKVSDWIKNCNPLKQFEYMASGKPIVSVEINEILQNYGEWVSVAYDKEQFCEAIVWELQNDTAERAGNRIDIAKDHSWEKHTEIISELIQAAIKTK